MRPVQTRRDGTQAPPPPPPPVTTSQAIPKAPNVKVGSLNVYQMYLMEKTAGIRSRMSDGLFRAMQKVPRKPSAAKSIGGPTKPLSSIINGPEPPFDRMAADAKRKAFSSRIGAMLRSGKAGTMKLDGLWSQ